jgi:hypothetical protein
MSDFQAIAGVSATLRTLLRDRIEVPPAVTGVTTVEVTVGVPQTGATPMPPGLETARANLYLYRVSENGNLKNQEIPGHGHPAAYGRPPLSLDLYYLLTAYGTTKASNPLFFEEILAHYVLGGAMRVLHDYPMITEQLATVRPPIGETILHPSLRGEFERVKLSLDPVSLEDVTKVWTALELPYRVSAGYKVTVVQIESRRTRLVPRPVGEPTPAGPRVFVVPVQRPQIDELRVRRASDPPGTERAVPYARIGDTLILRGGGFSGESVRVRIGALDIPVVPLSDDRIELTLPDATIGSVPIPADRRLEPGPQTVSVTVGVSGFSTVGFPSNQAAFMLVPLIAAATAAPRTLNILGQRLYSPRLTGETLVGRALASKADYITPQQGNITVSLADTLPARAVPCLLSGLLSFPIPEPPQLDLEVKIGALGFRTVNIPSGSWPATIAEAAVEVERAIRSAGPEAIFRRAVVRPVVSLAGDQLAVVAGDLVQAVTFRDTLTAPVAGVLGLISPPAIARTGYASGELAPFPALSAASPQVSMTVSGVGGGTFTVAIPAAASVAALAPLLENVIQSVSPQTGFQDAHVIAVRDQLLVIPGNVGAATFAPATADPTTVVELQLVARYPIRVRVNGAESIDPMTVELPP